MTRILDSAKGRIRILAPVIKGRKGEYHRLFDRLRKKGFVRLRLDGVFRDLEEEIILAKTRSHTGEVLVDDLRRCLAEAGEVLPLEKQLASLRPQVRNLLQVCTQSQAHLGLTRGPSGRRPTRGSGAAPGVGADAERLHEAGLEVGGRLHGRQRRLQLVEAVGHAGVANGGMHGISGGAHDASFTRPGPCSSPIRESRSANCARARERRERTVPTSMPQTCAASA